jgi:phosphohistidine phosphatase
LGLTVSDSFVRVPFLFKGTKEKLGQAFILYKGSQINCYFYFLVQMSKKRNLIVIRHTKSEWGDFSTPDFDRPIKKDRAVDAKEMASKLKSLELEPDLIICSPAKRTRQTAEYFCEKLKYDAAKIQFDKRIYESSEEDILQVVHEIPEEIKTLVIIGHNPSLTHFANLFIQEKIEDLPTTGVVWIEFKTDNWEIYKNTTGKLKYFLSPKAI